MKAIVVSTITAAVVLFTACDDLDEYRKEVDEKYQSYLISQMSELEGTWGRCDETDSTYFSSSSTGIKIKYTLGYKIRVDRFYSDPGCSGNLMGIIERSREYMVEGPDEYALGVNKKRFYVPETTVNKVIFTHPNSVTSANAGSGAYGRTDWVLGKVKSISYWIDIDGTDTLSLLIIYYNNGWDLWARDYYEVNGSTLTLYDKNTIEPWKNNYPTSATTPVDYTRL